MKKSIVFGFGFACLIGFASCTGSSNNSNQENQQIEATEIEQAATPTWVGTYVATLPCADCEGIETTVVLNADGTYTMDSKYLGKDHDPFVEKGSFVWNEDKTIIILTSAPEANGEKQVSMFKVLDGKLQMLDQDGKEHTGDLADFYIFQKK